MMTSILQRKCKDEYSYNIINNNLIPKLKIDYPINDQFNNENNSDRINTYNETRKLNKLNFLFPSKSIEVRNDIFNNL